MKARNSNLELLRIFAMVGVIILHICNSTIGGGFACVVPFSLNHYILCVLESLFFCAVDLYLMITGFFMSRSTRPISWRKPVALLLQVSIFRFGFYCLDILRGAVHFSLSGLFSSVLPVNYFVVLYCALYCISPYLNRLLQSLDDRAYGKLVLISLLLFALQPTLVSMLERVLSVSLMGLNAVGMRGDQNGYTIVNFILCYIIGGGLARLKPVRKSCKFLAGFVLCLSIMTLWFAWGTGYHVGFSAEKYNNPLVLAMAAFLILLFQNWDLGASRCINFLAKAAFTVFLGHQYLFKFIPFKPLFTMHPAVMTLAILGCGAGLYLIWVPVWFLYDKGYAFLEKYALLLWKRLRNIQE